MADFIIQKRGTMPRSDQETVIRFDRDLGEWFFYSNVPTHARKYEDAIIPDDNVYSTKVYHLETGELIELSGRVDGSVSVRKKKEISDERREEMRLAMKERMNK